MYKFSHRRDVEEWYLDQAHTLETRVRISPSLPDVKFKLSKRLRPTEESLKPIGIRKDTRPVYREDR